MKRDEIARLLGCSVRTVSRRIASGALPTRTAPRQRRPIDLDPALVRVLGRLDGARAVVVPAWSWALLVELLPHATPETLAYEVAGALRAAVGGAGVGRRRVEIDDGSADRLTKRARSATDRIPPTKAERRR